MILISSFLVLGYFEGEGSLEELKFKVGYKLEIDKCHNIERSFDALQDAYIFISKLGNEYYCRETGRYEDEAKEWLMKYRGKIK